VSAGAAPVSSKATALGRVWTSIHTSQVMVLVGVIVVVAVVVQIQNPIFLTENNLISLLRGAVTTFVLGVGLTLVFTSGGIDMSVGAVFTLGGITAAAVMQAGVPWPVGIAVGLSAGVLAGAVNAALIIVVKIPPIIATISTLYAVTGLTLVATSGNPISSLPPEFSALGQSSVGSIPLLVVYAVVIGVVAHVLLAHTKLGYDLKAIGGNERSALSNGVPVVRLKVVAYAISGGVAALAGILYTARTGTADPGIGGTNLTFAAISAVLIGGTSLFGGIGTIAGTALGALLFAAIQNGLTVAGVNPLYQNIVIGVILASAVASDGWRRRRAFKVGRS
jgi:ribose transport system permease protein